MKQIKLSPNLYDKVVETAAKYNQTPDQFVETLLVAQLLPPHPYVEILHSRSDSRAVIRGTRIGVDVIVGYTQAGYTPQEIASDILPHITLAQVYDALSYYEDYRTQIEEVLQTSTPEVWQSYLERRLGPQATSQLLSTSDAQN